MIYADSYTAFITEYSDILPICLTRLSQQRRSFLKAPLVKGDKSLLKVLPMLLRQHNGCERHQIIENDPKRAECLALHK